MLAHCLFFFFDELSSTGLHDPNQSALHFPVAMIGLEIHWKFSRISPEAQHIGSLDMKAILVVESDGYFTFAANFNSGVHSPFHFGGTEFFTLLWN